MARESRNFWNTRTNWRSCCRGRAQSASLEETKTILYTFPTDSLFNFSQNPFGPCFTPLSWNPRWSSPPCFVVLRNPKLCFLFMFFFYFFFKLWWRRRYRFHCNTNFPHMLLHSYTCFFTRLAFLEQLSSSLLDESMEFGPVQITLTHLGRVTIFLDLDSSKPLNVHFHIFHRSSWSLYALLKFLLLLLYLLVTHCYNTQRFPEK